ncbi:unnamed protein product [Phytophthora fragariaefolia]|uniref:Unnamed protein product n=1 Tax=Phytophthora fragariaefolia TaxID=1490495 RepID=A0A9W6TKV9_9STRA|nr:unnamed protein product [Phytophthora fragariaefolia]
MAYDIALEMREEAVAAADLYLDDEEEAADNNEGLVDHNGDGAAAGELGLAGGEAEGLTVQAPSGSDPPDGAQTAAAVGSPEAQPKRRRRHVTEDDNESSDERSRQQPKRR